ncbi:MAG TPA: GWxTD domain-containing protein [Candidatus Krumholzibacterium sp.]|nr:GWxTD domain-containing protein [Candidatus Krumholzibacterium sp.]
MRKTLLSILVPFLSVLACSIYSTKVLREDFLDPAALSDSLDIEEEIERLKAEIYSDTDDPSLHRELAVYYRMLGTPHSRALSIDEIDRAIALDPENPLNHIEKGLTLYAMRFNGEAAASMKRAVRADPGSFQAWYQLARIEKDRYLVNMCFPEHRDEAIRYYKKAYNIDDSHEDTLFNLGFLHLLRGMPRTSMKYASRVAALHPENPRHHLLIGSVYFRMGEFEKASAEYALAISLMGPDESLYYLETLPLLDTRQREDYGSWPEAQRREWNRRFWIRNDPTPATEMNERLLTHYERVFYARELLAHRRMGIDGAETARGFALISYGLPDKFLYNLGGGLSGSMVIWEYDRGDPAFRLYFMDEFLNGNYIIPIDPGFTAIADATQNVFDNIPQVYTYPVEFVPAPLNVVTAQSRSPEDETLIEFAAAVPDSVFEGSDGDFTVLVSIFDGELTRIVSESFDVAADTMKTISRLGQEYRMFHFEIGLIPPAGECNLVMEFTGGSPFRRGTWDLTGEIGDFPRNTLCMSSIRLVLGDGAGGCGNALDPLPLYPRGSRICLAYGIYGLTRGLDNMSHYRLTYTIKPPPGSDEGMKGLRRMMYWIARSARGGRDREVPFISSSLEQRVDRPDVSDNIQIDLGSVEPGRYLLHVLVEDLAGGGTVSSEREFIVSGSSPTVEG